MLGVRRPSGGRRAAAAAERRRSSRARISRCSIVSQTQQHRQQPDEERSAQNLIKRAIKTFIENTSLRGFRKCYSNQYRVLRVHWLVYLLSMTAILSYGSYELIKEYFEYHTTYQIEERVNDPTHFPSITVCSIYPFSPSAHAVWSSGRVGSPSKFSRQLRRSMAAFVRRGALKEAATLFHYDRVSTYFQQLNSTDLKLVEHSIDEIMPFCTMRHSSKVNPSVSHSEPCRFKVRRIRHPDYLTCYTLQLPLEKSSQVSDVSLVLSNVKFKGIDHENISNNMETGRRSKSIEEHVYNIFTQGAGFKIVLHEPETYPQLDEESFGVQMQTSTLIRYRTIRYQKDSARTDECSDNTKVRVNDADQPYRYTRSSCISKFIGQYILERCHCISAFHLRPHKPDLLRPYCGHFNANDPQQFVDRIQCIRELNLTDAVHEAGLYDCSKRCSHHAYESHMSSSNWEPSLCQFHWVRLIERELEHLEVNPGHARAKQELLRFAEFDSITMAPELEKVKQFEETALKSMALVTVTRLNYRTLVSREKLQISLSALWSRLGGLGSLTLGVTVTFAFELVELIYLLIRWTCKNLATKAGLRKKRTFSLDTVQDDATNFTQIEPSNRTNGSFIDFAGKQQVKLQQQQEDKAEADADYQIRQVSFYDNVPPVSQLSN